MRLSRSALSLSLALFAGLAVTIPGAGPAAGAAGRQAPLVPAAAGQAVPGRYIVVLAPQTPPLTVHRVAALGLAYGARITATYTTAVAGFAADLPPQALAAVRADPRVAYVEADQWLAADAQPVTAAATVAPTWNLDRIDQRQLPLDGHYAYRGTGAGVTAYVLDTGIDISQPQLGGRAAYGYDFVDGDANADDCNGHGTHVAGVIGAQRWGVANRVHEVALRVLDCAGKGTDSDVLAGVDWVTAHAQLPAVTNMSMSGAVAPALDQAVTQSINAGITYAIAAGNAGTDACNRTPARTPTALTVGASDVHDRAAVTSNQGPCVDLWAPGVRIESLSLGPDPRLASGTSSAAPHVAGVAAIYLAAHPDATPAQVASAIVSGATVGVLSGVHDDTANRLVFVPV